MGGGGGKEKGRVVCCRFYPLKGTLVGGGGEIRDTERSLITDHCVSKSSKILPYDLLPQ